MRLKVLLLLLSIAQGTLGFNEAEAADCESRATTKCLINAALAKPNTAECSANAAYRIIRFTDEFHKDSGVCKLQKDLPLAKSFLAISKSLREYSDKLTKSCINSNKKQKMNVVCATKFMGYYKILLEQSYKGQELAKTSSMVTGNCFAEYMSDYVAHYVKEVQQLRTCIHRP